MNYLDQIKNIEEHGIDEWTVKIFSQQRISDEWLANVFGEGKVGWVYRKEVRFLFFCSLERMLGSASSKGLRNIDDCELVL